MTLQQRLTQAPAREFEFRNYLVAEAYFTGKRARCPPSREASSFAKATADKSARPIEKTRPKASILS